MGAKFGYPPIFVFPLVEANLPNLIPAKLSGYTLFDVLII
jgi:hypothetical protein